MKFIYDGVEYFSRNQACLAFGLKYITVYQKAKNEGWEFKKALDYYTKEHKLVLKQPFEYKGKKYPNLTTLVKELGFSMPAIQMWASRRGYSTHEGFEKYIEYLNKVGYFYNGLYFKSRKALARYLELKPMSSFLKVLGKSKDVEKAIEKFNKMERKKEYPFTFNGVYYPSLRQLCKAYGITYKNVTNYALNHDMDRLEAFKLYLKNKGSEN